MHNLGLVNLKNKIKLKKLELEQLTAKVDVLDQVGAISRPESSGSTFFYIDDTNRIKELDVDECGDPDNAYWLAGNYYFTYTQAQKVQKANIDRRFKEQVLAHFIQDSNWKEDWKNDGQLKAYVYFDDGWKCATENQKKQLGVIYFDPELGEKVCEALNGRFPHG